MCMWELSGNDLLADKLNKELESGIYFHLFKYLYDKQIITDDIFDITLKRMLEDITNHRDTLIQSNEPEIQVNEWYNFMLDITENKIKDFETSIKEDIIKESKKHKLN